MTYRMYLLTLLITLGATACPSGRERGSGSTRRSVQCNPACPAGQRCVAGANGGPNECVDGMQQPPPPPPPPPPPTGGGIGAACNNAEDCSVPYCASFGENEPGFCTDACTGTGQGTCPATYECTQTNDLSLCLPDRPQQPPPPPPPGDRLACLALNECLLACPDNDDACVQGCAGRADAEAIGLFNAAVDCIERTQCQGEACQQVCANEINACVNDT